MEVYCELYPGWWNGRVIFLPLWVCYTAAVCVYYMRLPRSFILGCKQKKCLLTYHATYHFSFKTYWTWSRYYLVSTYFRAIKFDRSWHTLKATWAFVFNFEIYQKISTLRRRIQNGILLKWSKHARILMRRALCVIFTILVSFSQDNAMFAPKAKINVFWKKKFERSGSKGASKWRIFFFSKHWL